MSGPSDDELVPVSVRLGEVVPPEEPEDWRRPLTWAAAAGILVAPLLAVAWFGLAPPAGSEPQPATWLLAASLAAGSALTGSTQIGALRTFAATVGAGLLGALLLVVAGTSLPGVQSPSGGDPSAAQALTASLAGLGGVLAAAAAGPPFARLRSRGRRFAVPGIVGGATALVLVGLIGGV